MSSFREIPVNIITHDTVLGRSMHNIDHAAHERLDRQMREWEKKNKVTIIPMGGKIELPTCYKTSSAIMPIELIEQKNRNKHRKKEDIKIYAPLAMACIMFI